MKSRNNTQVELASLIIEDCGYSIEGKVVRVYKPDNSILTMAIVLDTGEEVRVSGLFAVELQKARECQ